MEKGIFVKDIMGNRQINGLFAARGATLRKTRNGDPFWSLSLADSSGSIEAVIWSPLAGTVSRIDEGAIFFVAGSSSAYKNSPQVVINKIVKLAGDDLRQIEIGDFQACSRRDKREMLNELMELCQREFDGNVWKNLVFPLLARDNIREALATWPAAKQVHHDYAGGLLEHTLGVLGLCSAMAEHYREILDRPTLLAGALLHDIGKIRELSHDLTINYTDEGRLQGHIFLGLEILEPFLQQSGIPAPLQEHFKHLILSHHGALEYGSPCLPQTAEALALHMADDLDAKLARYRAAVDESGGEENRWSAWQDNLGRFFYRPPKTGDFA